MPPTTPDKKLKTLLVSGGLAILLLLQATPVAGAVHTGPGLDDTTWEIANQVSPEGVSTSTVGVTNTLTVMESQKYVLIVGIRDSGSLNERLDINGAVTGTYFSFYGTGGTTEGLVGYTTWDGTIFGAGVRTARFAFVAPRTESLSLQCTAPGACFGVWNSNLAPGYPDVESTVGYVGQFTFASNNVGRLWSVPSLQGEQAILDTQMDRVPLDELTYTRLNVAQTRVSLAAGGATEAKALGSATYAQSVRQNFDKGNWIESVRINVNFPGPVTNCGLDLQMLKSLLHPVDAFRDEEIRFGWQWTGGPANVLFTVNFVDSTVTASTGTVGSLFFGASGFSGLNAAQPPFVRSTDSYINVLGCAGSELILRTDDPYSEGQVFENTGTGWGALSGRDFAQIELKTYGGNEETWSLAATPQNIGGASYVFVKERQFFSIGPDVTVSSPEPGLFRIVSDYGGTARPGQATFVESSIFLPADETIREWRIGYLNIPANVSATHTLRLNMTQSGSNILYAGIVTTTQPAHPNVGRVVYTSSGHPAWSTYTLWSTDDYSAVVTVQVKECLNLDCTELGNITPNVTYVANIADGFRTVSGIANATGNFTITGQDLVGLDLVVTVNDSPRGYTATSWDLDIPSAGYHNFTIGIQKARLFNSTATLQAPEIRFYGNFTRVIPDPLIINITRNRPMDLLVDCVRLDTESGIFRSACRVTNWTATDEDNAFQFRLSFGNTTASQVGIYQLLVSTTDGVLIGQKSFCIARTWATMPPCNYDLQGNDAAQAGRDSVNELAAALQEAEEERLAAQEENVRRYYLSFLEIMLRDTDFGFSNALIFITVSGMIFAGRVGGNVLGRFR